MERMTCGVFVALLVVTCVHSLSLQPADRAETSPIRRPFPFPRCGPVCMIHCPFGNVMDSRGCPTCRCRDTNPVCPQLKCLRNCPNGYRTVDGCRTCQCKDERRLCSDRPLCRRFCPNGFVKDVNGCTLCQCKSDELIRPVRPQCGPICRLGCPNGFVEDSRGCPICKCRSVEPRSCRRQCVSYCLRSILRSRNPPAGCDCNCSSYRRPSRIGSRTY